MRDNQLVRHLVPASLVLAFLGECLKLHNGSYELVADEVVSGLSSFHYNFVPAISYLRFGGVITFLSLLLVVAAGFIAAMERGTWQLVPGVVMAGLVTLLVAGMFWTVLCFDPEKPTTLLSMDGGPFFCFMCLGIFAGMEENVWPAVMRWCLILAPLSALLSIWELRGLREYTMVTGANPPLLHMIRAFWLSAVLLLLRPQNRSCRLLGLTTLMVCMLIAIYLQRRSFIGQIILVLILFFVFVQNVAGRLSIVRVMWGVAMACVFLIGVSAYVSAKYPHAVDALIDRLSQDTRSQQYRDYFSQIPLENLILGMGPDASYIQGRGQYKYIDNQFLFILLRYGLPVLSGYCLAVFLPAFLLFRTRISLWEKGAAFVITLWMFALLGLAVYIGIEWNVANYMIIFLAGRCFHLAWLYRASTGGSALTRRPVRPADLRVLRS
jgi:hypothetical protein